jgi:membrane protease YdiL (CAAX protease family)
MSLGAALRALIGDLAALFTAEGARLWFLLGCGTVLQAAFWYLATPGPALLGFAPRAPDTAAVGITWTVVTLLAVPVLLFTASGGTLREIRLSRGDSRFGWAAVGVASLFAVPIVSLAAANAPELALAYPWAGAAVGRSVTALVGWAGLYALYYLSFETFYRGFLLGALERPFGTRTALWLQACAATMVHLGKPLPETLAALPASLLFGVIAVRTRSVFYPAIAHLVIGLTLDVAVLARSGALFQ